MNEEKLNENLNAEPEEETAQEAENEIEFRSLYSGDEANPDEELPAEEEVEPIKEKPVKAKPKLTPEERKKKVIKEVIEWIVSIAVAVLAVIVLKNFLFYPITVDGSSMNPTLVNKDRLFATAYDVNVVNKLEKGDVVICKYPGRTSKHPILKFLTVETDFVKRLVGMPGDTVSRVSGVTYINGVALDPGYQTNYSATYTKDENGDKHFFLDGQELLYVKDDDGSIWFMNRYGNRISEEALTHGYYKFDYEYVLGEDEYFCVGDNRYNSHDCRAWNGPDLPYKVQNNASGDVGPLPSKMIVGHVRSVFWPKANWQTVENNPDYVDPKDVK